MVIAPGFAWAQGDTGRISGAVRDNTGAVIPDTEVTAVRTETGQVSTAKTDHAGVYIFPNLREGTYSVSVTVPGFGETTKSGYALSDGAAVTVDFSLKPSSSEQVTVVTTTVDQVNTQTGEVSHVIDGETVRDLALNGRNYLDLLGTLPGSVQASLGDAISETTSNSTTTFNLNGARATANGLYIDGFINKDLSSNSTQFNNVGIDFIDHVKVQTSSFGAQYGQAAGPTVNAVTRSGTNSLHGTLLWNVRNSAVDATNYFSRNAVTYAPVHAHLRYNDGAGALGGPIVIPHVFDGHDRLFFFVGAEWKLIAQASQPTAQALPLQQELQGNFQETSGGTSHCLLGATINVYENGQFTQVPRPANCNISQYITPFGQAFANEEQFAISQATSYVGTSCDLTGCNNNGNTIYELPYPYRNREYVARIDWKISGRQNAYGRWFQDAHTTTIPIGDGATPVTPIHDEAPANSVLVSHSYVISTRSFNEVDFGLLFQSVNQTPAGNAWLKSTYGYDYAPFFTNSSKVGIPTLSLYGQATLDSESFANRYHPTYFQLQDVYTLVLGNQSLKIGGLIGRDRADVNGKSNYFGSASFTPVNSTNSSGYSIADALLGNFSTYAEAPNEVFGQFRMTQVAAYVDDVWRVLPKLSLNMGVRWEYETPWVAVQNNLTDFYPNLYDTSQAVQVNVDGTVTAGVGNRNNGLRRAGNGVLPDQYSRVPLATDPSVLAVPTAGTRSFYKGQNVVMPRFGLAYDLFGDGKTAIRAGAGLFYDTPQTNANFSTLLLPPYSSSVNIENGNMANVQQYANYQFPFAGMYTLDPNFQRTYVYQYNLGFQQQMPSNFFFQMNYVGAEGRHLLRHPDINGVDPSVEDCVAAAFQASGAQTPPIDWIRQFTQDTLPTDATGYATGEIVYPGRKPDTPVKLKNSSTCNVLPAVKSNGYGGYAGYDSIYQWRSDVDYNYNGLQVNLNRRVGKGRFTIAYTFSKALSTGSADTDVDHIELYNKSYNYGPTSYDRRHVISATYILQVGPLQRHNLVMREALASWMVTGTARYQTGTYNTVSGTDTLGIASRGNYCGYPILYGHNPQHWFYIESPSNAGIAGAGLANFTRPTPYLPTNSTAFPGGPSTSPCGGNYTPGYGNAPVGNIIGPSFANLDVSLRKTFEISERYRLRINLDAFNALNHPNFGVPYLNINSATTGTGSSATAGVLGVYEGIGSAGRPRNIAGGAQLTF